MFSRVVWAWSNLDNFLNFTGRDLRLYDAKFGLQVGFICVKF
ncbi:hypothetical protein CAMRE0001_0632 [Campylobacter rectus RM3267]|uniref:Uncharacterized protein n=1 Tax=Campylobacter rectus RM3267 TaxID=553218 RepID=B9D1H3_CAMRE|nr:hypothetical protein CAMRE0001_0632 [Campylobacter rectus RM3267]